MKIAVIYYSRTRYTEKVAMKISQELDADLLQIKSKLYPEGFWGYWRAALHAFSYKNEKIETGTWNLLQYDLVILGTPIWGSHVSAPMRSFLSTRSKEFRSVAFFVTCGGSGASTVFDRMEKLCGQEPIATLEVTAKDFNQKHIARKVTKFCGKIRLRKPKAVAHA